MRQYLSTLGQARRQRVSFDDRGVPARRGYDSARRERLALAALQAALHEGEVQPPRRRGHRGPEFVESTTREAKIFD